MMNEPRRNPQRIWSQKKTNKMETEDAILYRCGGILVRYEKKRDLRKESPDKYFLQESKSVAGQKWIPKLDEGIEVPQNLDGLPGSLVT